MLDKSDIRQLKSNKMTVFCFYSLSLAAVINNLTCNSGPMYSEHHLSRVLILQSLRLEQSNSPCTLRQDEKSLIAAQSHSEPIKSLVNLRE